MPCCLLELQPQSTIPAAQGPGSQGAGQTKLAILHYPRTGRGGESTGRRGLSCYCPQAVQISVPTLPWEHLGQCGLGAVVVTVGADSRAGELGAATVVAPPGVSQGKLPLSLKVASQDKQLLLSCAPGRGLSSSPRCTHLRISTAGPSPRSPAGRTEEEQVLDPAAAGKL